MQSMYTSTNMTWTQDELAALDVKPGTPPEIEQAIRQKLNEAALAVTQGAEMRDELDRRIAEIPELRDVVNHANTLVAGGWLDETARDHIIDEVRSHVQSPMTESRDQFLEYVADLRQVIREDVEGVRPDPNRDMSFTLYDLSSELRETRQDPLQTVLNAPQEHRDVAYRDLAKSILEPARERTPEQPGHGVEL